MLRWPIEAARAAGAERVVVIASPERDLSPALDDGVEVVLQTVADGTGGAIRAAREAIRASQTVLVLSGDHPLIGAELLEALLATHREAGAAATLVTVELDEPGSYGRVVRDPAGEVERVVEAKQPGDATAEQLAIREVNAGTYAFEAQPLADALERISNENAQGEYYLGDVLPVIREAGLRIAAYRAPDVAASLGVNTQAELAAAADLARRRVLERHMLAGVTVTDPGSTWIEAEVEIAPGATIEPYCFLRGRTAVGAGTTVGPMTTLLDVRLGAGVSVPHSYLAECEVLDGASIGPFAHIRPGTRLGEGAKAGAFVELKNAQVGAGSKVPHLSYVGDAEVGEGANLGAGTITANYDGFEKHRTTIGDRVRTGVQTALVAPVSVGDDAYTGAGSVIVDDVPAGALGIGRERQRNVEGYAERRVKRAKQKEED